MGCGSSRSPARVGVLIEDDDDDALYPEFYPALVNSWLEESVRGDAPSYCTSASPPPYTPLPLSGHVTLMLGHGSSPTKRQDSTVSVDSTTRTGGECVAASSSQQQAEVSGAETGFRGDRRVREASIPGTSFHRERRVSGHREETEEREETVAVGPDPSEPSTGSTTIDNHCLTSISHANSSTAAVDIPAQQNFSTSAACSQPTTTPALPSIEHIALSSSFPSARPPSPYPRARSLSFQLPPLRTLHTRSPAERPRSSPPPEIFEHAAFRLPPLALQRQQLPSVIEDHDQQHRHHHHRKSGKKRLRVRSHSCQLQTTGLGPVQEQTVPIIQ